MLKQFLRSIMSYAIVFLLVFCSSVKYAHATDESDNTVERYDSRLSYSYCAQLASLGI